MKAWVETEDIALAQYISRLLYNREKEYASISRPVKTAYIFTIPEVREEYEKYIALTRQKLQRIQKEYESLITGFAEKYYHAAYAYATILRSSVPLFIAYPPQATTKKQPALKPSAYINTLFMPVRTSDGRKITTVASKILYKNFVVMRNYRKLDKYLESMPRLKQFVEKKRIQYVNRGYPEKRAWKLALRDMVRVIIGNIWLVGIYYLVEEHAIEPEDIILPYELAREPELHQTMIDPVDTMIRPYMLPIGMQTEVKYITWEWLIKTVPH